ncbi:pollen-specific leucine-rich repeat extensin-like protein 2 [Magnolia sinica]|uniref:pollen-specific leucine-rich repeat extensin-like protein 2 n=1 Tax=Magnolia sinica TaxID=86752 RepID=UPI002659165F|nr:pollen-specific leucine-rich repeat extensin-like protein 2 [Magnolia sinica]
MNSSQFMDKEILGLSGSSPQSSDFFDLLNLRPEDQQQKKKDEIFPSYDFHPIRSVGVGGSSSSVAAAMNLETTVAGSRVWNSADSKTNNASGFRNYDTLEPQEFAKVSPEKDTGTYDTATVSEIDRTMKKHADNLLHALEGVSARLSQLETRTRNLESSVDDLKATVGNNNGSTDGRLRQLENILKEVQVGVQVLHDKQEIADAQLKLAKLQVSKEDHQAIEKPNTPQTGCPQQAVSLPQELIQPHLPPAPFPQPPQVPALPPPNAPPPPLQQNPMPAQLQTQLPQNQIPSMPPLSRDPYLPLPGPPPEAHHQQYQMPVQQPPPPHQQYQGPPPQLPQYSQPVPLPQQQHQPIRPAKPPLSHHPEESPYVPPPQTYPPNIRQPAPLTQPPGGSTTSQQIYGPPTHMYEPSESRPSSGQPPYSAGYSLPSGPNFSDSYPYSGSPSHYSSSVKPSSQSSPSAPTSGSGYPRLPTAQILPHALPTATSVSSGPSAGGTGNRVPIDDVVDKVATMGFSREQVRATVRKLTENGQSVDLNVVLDKLMNDTEIQPQKGWFGR